MGKSYLTNAIYFIGIDMFLRKKEIQICANTLLADIQRITTTTKGLEFHNLEIIPQYGITLVHMYTNSLGIFFII